VGKVWFAGKRQETMDNHENLHTGAMFFSSSSALPATLNM
jgi:hypothetical protein